LNPRFGNARYAQWVKSSLQHPVQCLLKVLDGSQLIGFFLVEYGHNHSVYWHLTAIAPRFQGQGLGRQAWNSMLRAHQMEGIRVIATTISARNTRVLNLYTQLGFRFAPPHMTFHWIR
jgi:RimJ/RimL family protein N-acetyltransferase